ncbi:PASTA domain-containing protein [Desulfurivibrio dismutans]|uniref:PASTA domain-containing protein n=1 Tax=Desulfurivibrio dismutans TaxID=1398908 RepID=UPI0023DA66BF|nr:PASTA domain-containing protein [Desulfurivibrio alkaliphilus]MDF1613424.1 PASTA domain-containing protein [Desulfurivibrio alkaliphilus]
MPRTMSARQRGKKMLFLILLLPVLGLVVWGFLSLSGADQKRLAAGYHGETLVKSSTLRRNNIYDRHFDTLALSFRLSSLYARPLEINDPEGTAVELARLLDLDSQVLLDSFRSERSFVWLSRQTRQEVADEVLGLGLPGIYVMPGSHRYYPHRDGAAHAVGFVKDEQGLAGIELSYDNILRGGVSDIRLAAAGVPDRVTAGGGVHLVSTLDIALQRELEHRLARVLRSVDGAAAAGLVMEVATGAVLAMASLPAYDPNRFWAAGAEERLNRAVIQVHIGALRELFQRAAGEDDRVRPATSLAGGAGTATREGLWYRLAPDVYASAFLGGNSRTGSFWSEEFLRQVGLCQDSDLDLLEGRSMGQIMQAEDIEGEGCRQLLQDNRAAVNGVSLLASFSRLVNAGSPVKPHVIKGFWDGEEFWPRQSAVAVETAPAATGTWALKELLNQTGSSGQVATYESLVAEVGPLALQTAELAAMNAESPPGSGGVQENQPAETAAELSDRPKRYQAVMLGLAPREKPVLAALIFVERAGLDLELPSPLAGVIRDLDQWSNRLNQSAPLPASATILAREEALYHKWLEKQETGELQMHATARRAPEKMPDVVGLSLRKALQVLHSSGLRFQVKGSGRVVYQEPPPGASLRGVDEGVIELRVPGGEMVAAGSN